MPQIYVNVSDVGIPVQRHSQRQLSLQEKNTQYIEIFSVIQATLSTIKQGVTIE